MCKLNHCLEWYEVIVICATAYFDIGYKVSDICDDEGDTAHCSCYLFHCRSRSVYVYNEYLAWYYVL